MNTEPKTKSKDENVLRKWGLENVIRQFIRTVSTTALQALRDVLKNVMSKK